MPAQAPVSAGEWEEVPLIVIEVLPGFAVTHTENICKQPMGTVFPRMSHIDALEHWFRRGSVLLPTPTS